MIERHNPSITTYSLPIEPDESFNVASEGFAMAFAAEGFSLSEGEV